MPRASENATESAPKTAAFLVAGLALFSLTLIFSQRKAEAPAKNSEQTAVVLGNQSFSFEVADETSEQATGLSGRTELASNEGMLFVFDKLGEQCIWMKDMNFALDMVWLNEEHEIVKIKENVNPETYPEKFCSNEPAKYVIEVNSGTVKTTGLTEGQTLSF